MPSEIMHRNGLSSSSFFSEKRQMGFWKTQTTPDHYGVKMDGVLGGISVPLLPLEKRTTAESKMGKHAVGAERAATNSFRRPVDHDPEMGFNLNTEPASNFREGDEIRVMGAQYENGLFSSSLSELFSRKLRLTSNNALYGHPVGDATSHYEEDEPFESLDEIEAQTIGNLLPSDDDLLSGVTDGLDYVVQPNAGEEIEDLDLFSSVGGMDLGEDCFPPGKIDSELPGGEIKSHLRGSVNSLIGEHPSRTLFVRNINSNVEDSELWALFEQYGDIRTLYATCKHRGFVMISYYDIRAAWNAMRALQKKPLKHRKLDIHFSIPKDNTSEKDVNQGTLAVFNLDSSVSNEELHQIFGVYGEIMEIREALKRSHHKFIEFYDVRAAEAALRALNRGDIGGKRIKLEPSRAGCGTDCLMPFPPDTEQDESGPYLQLSSSPSTSTKGFSGPVTLGGITSAGMGNGTISGVHSAIRAPVSTFLENVLHHGISSGVPTSVSSVLRVESLGNQSSLPESGHSQGQLKVELQGSPHFHPHSFQEYHDGFTNGSPCNSSDMAVNIKARPSDRIENRPFSRVISNGHPFEPNDAVFDFPRNGTMPSPGHQYLWSNAPQPRPQCLMWPNSPTFVNRVCTAHPASRLHALPRAPPHMLNTCLPITGHHVGSAPSANPHFWDRRNTYAGESPNASGFQPGSLGNMRISGYSPHHLEFVSQNIFSHVGGNCMDLPIPSKNVGLHCPHRRCLMFPVMNLLDSTNEWPRSRRNEGSANQADNKKQFELGIDRIMRGEDKRTTLMIKNIPNKYTSKMLLAAIDESHKGTYDFLYLPIDFKNKCNVGYAFINMIDPSLIIPFYEAFNGKKWEKFNSEKIASLAYARIQGKSALIAHFQNSSLMNEDKRCRPLLFDTDGPNAGDQVPFPMGVDVRLRPSKTRAVTSEENHHESTPNLPNGEESFNGDLSSRSTKDSD